MYKKPVFFAIIFTVLLITVAAFYYLYVSRKEISPTTESGETLIQVANNYPSLQVSVNKDEFWKLAKETSFVSPEGYLLNDMTLNEFKPKTIILSFYVLGEETPNYFKLFRANNQDIQAFSASQSEKTYYLNYYLSKPFFDEMTESEADDSVEALITNSLSYIGSIYKKKDTLTDREIEEGTSDYYKLVGKYNTVNVEKI